MRRLFLAMALLVLVLPAATSATEEPDYAVVRKVGGVEVRFYAPYVVAQILVAGPEDMAGYQAFPILADYTEHLDILTAALRAADLAWTGEPVYARYDPASTPWFMRRNEIWLALR